jgi:hypothetical protein
MLGPRSPLTERLIHLLIMYNYSTELEGDVRQMDRKWRRNSLESFKTDSEMTPFPASL